MQQTLAGRKGRKGGRCSGPAWANRTGLIWFSILSRNQKLKTWK